MARVPRIGPVWALALALVVACGGGGETGAGDPGDAQIALDTGVVAEPDAGPGGASDAVAEPDAPESPRGGADAGSATPDAEEGGCGCPTSMHCAADETCVDDVCVQGAFTCATPTRVKACNADGSYALEVECPEGQVCAGGSCSVPNCEPGEPVGCDGGRVAICDSRGIGTYAVLCPDGQACEAGECREIQPNILLLVDTSSSMNWTPDGDADDACPGQSCTPWSYPDCDDPGDPKRRLGLVKQALSELVVTEAAAGARLALARFPQRVWTATGPKCDGGYWTGSVQVEGDEDYHTLGPAWFAQRLWQVVVEPFPASGATDLDALARWFDFTESLAATAEECAENQDCAGTPCLDGHCQVFTDPELRGMGLTPLGKSLFYAGEYFRHFVVVEGKACAADADCHSAAYRCVAGACHDPYLGCRPNVVIAFTDGEETEHFYTNDFFHPRVQAKRLHYGLGCVADADCAGGATCVEWVCRPPAGEVDEAQMVCDGNGVACTSNPDCPGFRCLPAKLDFVDPAGADHLVGHAGQPISLTVHVVDASAVPGANQYIAAYGGGAHFGIDLDDPGVLLETFQTLLSDAKAATVCGE